MDLLRVLNLKEKSNFSASYGTIVHSVLEVFGKNYLKDYTKKKLTELAECVKQYDKHEYRTLVDTISARGKNMNGKEVKECLAAFSRVEERYPQLRSQENYKTLMKEIEDSTKKMI